jgi:plasmid stability protein
MSTLVLKGVPENLHRDLRERAQEHRRSVTQEAIGILEMALVRVAIAAPAKGLKPKSALKMSQVVKMVRDGRG